MMRKNQEISELKSRIAEVMALIPQPPTYPSKLDSPGPIAGKFCPPSMTSSSPLLQPQQQQQQHQQQQQQSSSLASLYPIGGHRLGGIGNMPSMPIGAPSGQMNMKPDAFTLTQQQQQQQQPPPQQQQQAAGQSSGTIAN